MVFYVPQNTPLPPHKGQGIFVSPHYFLLIIPMIFLVGVRQIANRPTPVSTTEKHRRVSLDIDDGSLTLAPL